jgi:hypothetical protein
MANALLKNPSITQPKRKKGFGSSGSYNRGKLFAFLSYRNRLILKLPQERVNELITQHIGARWHPQRHRPGLKEWIVIGPSLPQTVERIEEPNMESEKNSKTIVMSYIKALDSQNYDAALTYLNGKVRIKGPAGETFGIPRDFIEMLRRYHGKYDVKKIFAEGDDVCVLYDLMTSVATVYMSSWYVVKDGKIVSIQTVFDPRAFGPPPNK